MHAVEVWEAPGLSARVARTALTPLSWLYAAGWQAYLAAYRLGLKRPAEPHRPVVCVGNLMVGGTGKSPLTLHLADVLGELGHEVVVSTSGYGSPRAEAATLAPEGPLDPREWGDEPAMIRWLRPELPLVVGRRRVLAAELVARHRPQAVMLMDDGFQHLPLRKHLSLVLDPANPTNRRCLPAGPYREPRSNRRRADLVLPGPFQAVATPLDYLDPLTGERGGRPARFSLLCALGQPRGFLEAVGGDPGAVALLPDHDPLTAPDLLQPFDPRDPIIVTAKDWVKLAQRPDIAGRSFRVALGEVRVQPEADFRRWLRDRLGPPPAAEGSPSAG